MDNIINNNTNFGSLINLNHNFIRILKWKFQEILQIRALLYIWLFFWLHTTISSAHALSNIVVFGDSLSDTGNFYEYMQHKLPESPPYYKGRFTNGPVWVEHLVASYFSKNPLNHLSNYAYGGAGVSEDGNDEILFSLKREMDSYLFTHSREDLKNSLFIIWIGANNYLIVPDDIDNKLTIVIRGIEHGIQNLVKGGAEHILLMNLPNLGKIPMAKEFELEEVLSATSQKHNHLLAEKINELKKIYPQTNFYYYDVEDFVDKVMAFPQGYGFSNISAACYESMNNNTTNFIFHITKEIKAKTYSNSDSEICKNYLFFDLIHPTASAHEVMSKDMRNFLDNYGVEFIT